MKYEDNDPKQRLIRTAEDLLRRRGLASTSIRELAKHADAPLGSTYHYFPGGKPQLISTAVSQTGQRIARLLEGALSTGPVAGLEAFLANWRAVLIKGKFKAGCPVIAVAADDSSGDGEGLPLAAACDALQEWERLIAKSLTRAGVDADEASEIANLSIAAIEGAILICRAKQSIEPFDRVGNQLLRQVGRCCAEN